MKIVVVILLCLCFSCGTSSKAVRVTFEGQKIERAELKQGLNDSLCVNLSPEQIGQISEAVDFKQHSEPYKTIVNYWLVVKEYNDSVHYYKITNAGLFGEHDWYIRMRKKDFFENLWKKEPKVARNIPITY